MTLRSLVKITNVSEERTASIFTGRRVTEAGNVGTVISTLAKYCKVACTLEERIRSSPQAYFLIFWAETKLLVCRRPWKKNYLNESSTVFRELSFFNDFNSWTIPVDPFESLSLIIIRSLVSPWQPSTG